MRDYAERLRYANQHIEHIELAQRQERRLQRAYGKKQRKQDAIDLAATAGFAPPASVASEMRFSDSDEEEPGLSYSGTAKLREASGRRMTRVRQDLSTLRVAIGTVSEQEWDHCYITPDEAAEILGTTVEGLDAMAYPPRSFDFGDELGLRYWREAVEARKEGWLDPPRWADES